MEILLKFKYMRTQKDKTVLKHIGVLIVITAMVLSFVSCDKDEDYGIPRITNVRLTDPAQANVPLSEGELGQMVVIQGENLGSAQQVFFNSEEAFVLPTMITDRNIIVNVPSAFPLEITDQIRVITKGGEATYNFMINIPKPLAQRLPLEWVPEGQQLTILGSYFYNVESVSFTGGATTTNFTVENPETLHVIVPADAQSGPVTITAVAGSGTTRQWFRDNRGMMVDFSAEYPLCWGGDAYVVNASNIPANVPVKPISGNFFYIKKDFPDGSWWIQETVIAYCGGVTVTGAKSDYAVAFEMWVGQKWDKNWLEFEMFGSGSTAPVYYEWRGYNEIGGEAKALENTGWITVHIPLSNMQALTGNTFRLGRLGSFKAQHAATVEMAFDNLRLVPLK
jgi:hypothetical protein